MRFLSFVGNVITYFMVISYRGVNCGSKQQLKNGLQPFLSFEIELHLTASFRKLLQNF